MAMTPMNATPPVSKKLLRYLKYQASLRRLDRMMFRLVRGLPYGITIRTFDTNFNTVDPGKVYNDGNSSFLSASNEFGTVYPLGTFAGKGATDWMCLNLLQLTPGTAGGTDFYNRGSNKMFWLNLQIFLMVEFDCLTFNGGALATSSFFDWGRVLVYYDAGSDTAASMPVMNDLLYDNRFANGTMRDSMSFKNEGNKDRFILLRDESMILPYNASGQSLLLVDQTKNPHVLNMVIECKGLETEYTTTTGKIGDITKGKIIIKFLDTNDAANAPVWRLRGESRLTGVNAYN